MRRVLVFAGMPRSGTTYFSKLFSKNFGNLYPMPEECRCLANESAISAIVATAKHLYSHVLQEGTPSYSAWGSEEDFTSKFSLIALQIIGLISSRERIEAETINKSFIDEMEAATSMSLAELLHGTSPVLLKQPSAEILWRQHFSMLTGFELHYFIALRDPYLVFLSMSRLGWIGGLAEFLEMSAQSYQSTLELARAGRVVCCDISEGAETQRLKMLRFADRVGLKCSAASSFAAPESYWQNTLAQYSLNLEEKSLKTKEEFEYYFYRSPAGERYTSILTTPNA